MNAMSGITRVYFTAHITQSDKDNLCIVCPTTHTHTQAILNVNDYSWSGTTVEHLHTVKHIFKQHKSH